MLGGWWKVCSAQLAVLPSPYLWLDSPPLTLRWHVWMAWTKSVETCSQQCLISQPFSPPFISQNHSFRIFLNIIITSLKFLTMVVLMKLRLRNIPGENRAYVICHFGVQSREMILVIVLTARALPPPPQKKKNVGGSGRYFTLRLTVPSLLALLMDHS